MVCSPWHDGELLQTKRSDRQDTQPRGLHERVRGGNESEATQPSAKAGEETMQEISQQDLLRLLRSLPGQSIQDVADSVFPPMKVTSCYRVLCALSEKEAVAFGSTESNPLEHWHLTELGEGLKEHLELVEVGFYNMLDS